MRIERAHTLGQANAVQRIDGFVTDLLKRPLPAGIIVSNPQTTWNGSTMNFSFRASKGFFGATLAGVVEVGEQTVAIDFVLPPMVAGFVGEEPIRQAIGERLEALLA